MKKRPEGFLACDKIDHEGEIFGYIMELHEYLWSFIRCNKFELPRIEDCIDIALEQAKKNEIELDAYRRIMYLFENQSGVISGKRCDVP